MILKLFNSIILIVFIVSYSLIAQTATPSKQEKSITAGVKGLVATGPWRNRTSGGIGGNIKFEWRIGPRIAWFLQGGYYYIAGKKSVVNNTTYKTFFNDGEMMTGLKYYSKNNIFGLLGVSVNSFAFRTSTSQNLSGYTQETSTTKQAEKYGVILGGGYLYDLTNTLSLEGTGTFSYLGDEGSSLGLTVGLKIKFY